MDEEVGGCKASVGSQLFENYLLADVKRDMDVMKLRHINTLDISTISTWFCYQVLIICPGALSYYCLSIQQVRKSISKEESNFKPSKEMDPENIHFDNERLHHDSDDDGPILPPGRESVGEAASNIVAASTPTGVTGGSQSAESASVMDPRIKIKGVELLLRGIEENLGITLPSFSTVTALLTSIYASYESKFACTTTTPAPASSSIADPSPTSNNDPSWFLISRCAAAGGVSKCAAAGGVSKY
ncbi:hypothetical protein RHSIM_Rhsim05G0104900 [Rhododendron simsii]|uniref:Uncharacterized protein n=1 Tax=Rhododendron simsii TaxID=118357 RepID=A0A834GY37_RHOSS|nr:hypothetical protein RHSIM_Rhsim05G0104900 [Rhododendron simsii]